MGLLGDVGHVESCFGPFGDRLVPVQERCKVSRFSPFGDSVSVGARKVHGLRQTYHRLRNRFGRIRWYH